MSDLVPAAVETSRAPRAAPPRTASARGTFVLLSVLGLLGAGWALRHATILRAGWPREADALYLPSATTLRLLSLGHREMAADLISARANVYFGSQVVARGDFDHLTRFLETAATLDPAFHRLYLRGAAMLVYTGKEFSVEALLAANHLLKRGEDAFPGDWELPFQRGFNLLFELPRVVGEDDARVPAWRQQGAEALRDSTLLEGGPSWLPNLAAKMLTQQGSEELALRHLERAYAVTDNPETRRMIAAELGKLRRQQAVDNLSADEAKLDALKGSYPYAPESFALLAGRRLPRTLPILPPTLAVSPGSPLVIPPALPSASPPALPSAPPPEQDSRDPHLESTGTAP